MKKGILFFILLVFSKLLFAQAVQHIALPTQESARKLIANSTICFDKKISYHSSKNNGETMLDGCYYLNTRNGYVAMFMDHEDRSCEGLSNPGLDFNLIIVTKHGESFRYTIDKKGKKTVWEEPAEMTFSLAAARFTTVTHPSDRHREPMSDLNLPTRRYMTTASPGVDIYMHGNGLPASIPVDNYLGAFGTGYYNSNGKTYLGLALEKPNEIFVKIKRIENVTVCFNGSDFINERDEVVREQREIEDKKTTSLDRSQEELNGRDIDCKPLRQQLLNLKKQMLAKEKRATNAVQQGGTVAAANDPSSQQALLSSADVKDKVMQTKLETEIEICDVEYSISIAEQDNRNTTRYMTKRTCLMEKVDRLEYLLSDLTIIENRYSTNPAMGMVEKNKRYLREMGQNYMSCNFDKDGNKINVGEQMQNDPSVQRLRQMIQRR